MSILTYLASKVIMLATAIGISSSPAMLGAASPGAPALVDTNLAAPISKTDTSMTLANGFFRDGTPLTGDLYFTVDANSPSLEYIGGTASGTLITNLKRGVGLVNPNATSSALAYPHRAYATVQITDYPTLQFNTRKINGVDAFSAPIFYDSSITPSSFTSGTQAVSKEYVDNLYNGSSTGWLPNGTDIYNGNSGNVGVGTTSPDKKLTVDGTFKATGAAYLESGLTASGTITSNGALQVSGATNFSGSMVSNSTTTLAGTNNITGTTTLSGSTTISGPSLNINSTTTVNSPATFATTTTFSGQVVGLGPVIGTSTFSVVTSATTTDTTITTGFLPNLIRIYFFNQGHDKITQSNVYQAESGFAVIASSTKPIIVCYNGSGNTGGDNQSPSAIAARSCQGSGTAGGVFSAMGTNDPGVGTGNIYSTLSVPSVTNTGFTIRRTTTIGSSNSNNARAEISWEAYR